MIERGGGGGEVARHLHHLPAVPPPAGRRDWIDQRQRAVLPLIAAGRVDEVVDAPAPVEGVAAAAASGAAAGDAATPDWRRASTGSA